MIKKIVFPNPQGTDDKKVTFRTDMGWTNLATLIGCILGCNASITTIFFSIDRIFTQEYDGFIRFVILFNLAKLYLKI